MRSVVLALAILASFYYWTVPSPSAEAQGTEAQQTVTLEGRVVNRTDGAALEPGLRVTLHFFSQSSGVLVTEETATDDSGSFMFPDVEVLREGGYAITTDYADTQYSILVRQEDLEEPVELSVYETTQDISVILVAHQALIVTEVDPLEQMITAAVFVNLSNQSDRTLLPDLTNVGPGRFSFLRFSLPPEAEDLDVQSDLAGGQIIPTGSGFAMTAPVTPGEHNISFSFRFPYQHDALSYKQSLLQGADVFQVLIPQRLAGIQVPSLAEVTALTATGASYLVWERTGLAPGQGVQVELANLPRSNPLARWGRAATDAAFWQVALPVVLGTALAGLLVFGGVLGARRAAAANGPGTTMVLLEPVPPSHAELVKNIAVLDDEFQKGQINPTDYTSRRAELKALALKVGTQPGHAQDNPEGEAEIAPSGSDR